MQISWLPRLQSYDTVPEASSGQCCVGEVWRSKEGDGPPTVHSGQACCDKSGQVDEMFAADAIGSSAGTFEAVLLHLSLSLSLSLAISIYLSLSIFIVTEVPAHPTGVYLRQLLPDGQRVACQVQAGPTVRLAGAQTRCEGQPCAVLAFVMPWVTRLIATLSYTCFPSFDISGSDLIFHCSCFRQDPDC